MKRHLTFICMLAAIAASAADQLIASWDFTTGSLVDSVKGITLAPRGNCTIEKGKGLNPGLVPNDKPCGAVSQGDGSALAPKAFRLVMEFSLNEDAMEGPNENHLWDNKYLNYKHKDDKPEYNRGFMLELRRSGKATFRPQLTLGYGTESETVNGANFKTEPGKKHTISVEYDGLGNVTFTVDEQVTKARPLAIGAFVAPPYYNTVIGDRVMSSYHPLRGTIYSAKLYSVDIPPMSIMFPTRRAFRRGEANASFSVEIKTTGITTLKNAKLTFQGKDGITDFSKDITLNEKLTTVTFPVKTNLQPAAYPCTLTITADTDNGPFSYKEDIDLFIGPQLNPDDQVRFFWLLGAGYYEDLRDLGMSHILYHGGGYIASTNSFDPATHVTRQERMDKMLADGMTYLESCGFGNNAILRERYPRIKRDGSKVTANTDMGHPEAYKTICDASKQLAEAINQHPAFGGLLPASEIRDSSRPSFTDYNAKAFKDATGLDVPNEAEGRVAPPFSRLKHFPFGRIVPMDYPLLKFYTWFWKTGDGWNRYQSTLSDAFHKEIKHPIFSFYDPSVRVPPLYGSGGSVDYLNQWTYIYPEPFNISYVVSEQQAMARGRKGQGVITMIQGISYRSVLAPKDQQVANPPAWLAERPNVVYMTTPPDVMREGLWAIFSRKLEGIGLYAWRALFDASPFGYDKKGGGYQCTNPETIKVAAELYKRIALPFGPLLKTIPERKPEIAVLESYASTFFASRGTWGWHSHIYEIGTMLTGASMSPYVLYEEEAAKGIPESIKIIIAPHCDVLTQPAYEALRKFQANGGLIVADEVLTPALLADFTIPPFTRTQKADVDKVDMQTAATKLKAMLAPYYLPYSDTDNLDIFTHVRTYKDADYVFVINDRREFGDYVGQYGRLMERGLPNNGTVTVSRAAGAVYDLESHQAIPFTCNDGKTTIKTSFTTNDGKLLLLTSRPLGPLNVEAPKSLARGGAFTLTVTSKDADALIPIAVDITLAAGARVDNSGPGIVRDGRFTRTVSLPVNIQKGTMTVNVTNLADGSVVTKTIVVD